jgi:large subunit ribosomal protein L13
MVTVSAKAAEVERRWFVVDAADQPLGRLASRVATVLKGKHRPEYTPHVDTGDFVIVVNASRVKLTGAKLEKKEYRRHSHIPGGFKATPYRTLLAKTPELAIELAVKGMLPKNALGRKMRKKLKVYAGGTHPHAAQKPEPLSFG